MNPNQETMNPSAAADLPQAAPTLSPEGVIDQLRATRAQIGEMTPLTVAQRKALHGRIRMSNPILQASINVIGALDIVAKAIGQPADDMRLLCDETNRWTAVEDELRMMLNGVSGANLIRRHRLSLIAGQAYNIGSKLARDPAHAVLVPHVQEIKRLRSFLRRKKVSPAPGSPASSEPDGSPAASETPQM